MRLSLALLLLIAGCSRALPLEPGAGDARPGDLSRDARTDGPVLPPDGPQRDRLVSDAPIQLDLAPPDTLPTPDGPSTGPLTCTGYTMPSFSKVCVADADCVAVLHTINCCGTVRALGINVAGKALFKAEEQKCSATYPPCGCASMPTEADDGSTATISNNFGASCVNGSCTSYIAECSGPCLATGTTCKSCMTGASTVHAECSSTCNGDTDCPPGQAYCALSSYGGFCTASPVTCL